MENSPEKKYKNQINLIKAKEKLKKTTIEKIKKIEESKTSRRGNKIVLKLANAAILLLVILSIAWLIKENKIKQSPITVPDSQSSPNLAYKTVESFDNLYNIIKEVQDTRDISNTTEEVNEGKQESLTDSQNTQDYSTTNIQKQGVEEADKVKTDGEYVYYLNNNKLEIISIKNPDEIQVIKEISYQNTDKDNFYPTELFFKDNKLIVIGNYNIIEQSEKSIYCGENNHTRVIVYNVNNKEDIKEERTVELDGRYIDARLIGDNLYFISNKNIYVGDMLKVNLNPEDYKPSYLDTTLSKETQKVSYHDIHYFEESKSNNYTQIAGFNIKEEKPIHIQTFLGMGDQVYCSKEKLYIVTNPYSIRPLTRKDELATVEKSEKSEIYQFELKDGQITYEAKTEIEGTILNQFSMDEQNGIFRIAITKIGEDNKTSNAIYTFDSNLNKLGQIDNLAKDEKIYAARFQGNICYLVTYKQVDPLFVIDLSHPAEPKVLGELKIPGYSSYLHPYNEEYVIGFGMETETTPYGERNKGLKVSLYQIEDHINPKEISKKILGENNTGSSILYDHKALLQRKDKDIYGIPVTIKNEQNRDEFNGAILFHITPKTGIQEEMRIENNLDEKYTYRNTITRIVYANGNYITFSESGVKVTGEDGKERYHLIFQMDETMLIAE